MPSPHMDICSIHTHVDLCTNASPTTKTLWCHGNINQEHQRGPRESLTTPQPKAAPRCATPSPAVPPTPGKVPLGLPVAGSELRTPPRSRLPPACPGAGTAHPGSSEWCSQLGCGNRGKVSGSPGITPLEATAAHKPALTC